MVLSEMLVQSVGDVIRVFPAWPRQRNVHFNRLRTQGGFLVSSSISEGQIDRIEGRSTQGGRLRLVSPWKQMKLSRSGQTIGQSVALDTQGIAQVSTRAGEDLIFEPEFWRPYSAFPQHFLYFLPLPHGQGSLRPTLGCSSLICLTCISPWGA